MTEKIVITVISTIVAVISTVLTISSHYVTKDQFGEFKDGTVHSIFQRLDSIDKKLDRMQREK